MSAKTVHIVGAGLAGSEAAWQLASRGVKVIIHEMRPLKSSPAHKTDKSAELVCSNSLRSDDYTNSAIGLLHQEMRLASSLIMEAADTTKVPAGGALAVDRAGFSQYIDSKLHNHPLIEFITEEITELPMPPTPFIIAAGPLASQSLTQSILAHIAVSEISGTFSSTQASSQRIVAATIATAAFFAPLIETSPSSFLPPFITYLYNQNTLPQPQKRLVISGKPEAIGKVVKISG